MAILNMVYGGGGSSIKIPLDAISDLAAAKGNAKATITWTDPNDKTYDGITLVAWSKTILVRKVGSAPTSVSDGTVVLTSTVKNQYSSTGYEDTGLTNGTTYYYAAFAIGDNGTSVISNTPSVKPAYQTYTITWNETSSPSSFNPVYSDDAAGLTAGSTDFDDFFGYSAVKLASDGTESSIVSQNAGVLDITQLGTLTSGDNVMIKFPVRGIKMSKSGSKIILSITDAIGRESEGYQYYAFQKTGDINANANTTVATTPLYMGAYLSYTNGSKLQSWSGQTPQGNYTMRNAIRYAGANGTGWTITGWYQRQLINAYYMMKYGNPDCQSVIGRGFVDGNRAAHATGGTNSYTNASWGETTGKYQCKLFGLEDWRGNQNQWVGGMFTDGSKNMYTALHDFTANMSTSESQYKNAGSLNYAASKYYMSSILGTNKGMFGPAADAGSNSTYYCDLAYVNASCLVFASGNWSNGSSAGAFCLNVGHSASYADTDVGTRLMYL